MKKTRFEMLIGEGKNDYEYRTEELLFDIIEDILTIMEEKNINRTKLAKKMGVNKSCITRLLEGPPNVTIETLAKIAIALDTDIKIEFKKSAKHKQFIQVKQDDIQDKEEPVKKREYFDFSSKFKNLKPICSLEYSLNTCDNDEVLKNVNCIPPTSRFPIASCVG